MRSAAVVLTIAMAAESAVEAFPAPRYVTRKIKPSSFSWVLPTSASKLSSSSSSAEDNGGDDGDDATSLYAELAHRIEALSAVEASQAAAFDEGLRRRVEDVAAADAAESELLLVSDKADGNGQCQKWRTAHLPVVALDVPLLPRQQLSGMTSDPTFCSFLRDLGLGGLLVLISVNRKQRKVRRSGVLARIESVDVDRSSDDKNEGTTTPSAVRYNLSGKCQCRIVGPARDMVAMIGRWRKCYDPDGEETALGWGEEKFTDSVFGGAILKAEDEGNREIISPSLENTKWPTTEVCCFTIHGNDRDAQVDDDEIVARAAALLPVLDRWLTLASDPATYRNLDVVASDRLRPGGSVDPSRLLRTVLEEMGDRPPPTKPTALVFWGAALITSPLLSVSAPEIRGAILEAANASRCLDALERGLTRSIENLEGTKPLCP